MTSRTKLLAEYRGLVVFQDLRRGWCKPGVAIVEDDVHRAQQERVGEFDQIVHEFGQQRPADAQMSGQRVNAPDDFGSGLEQ